MPLALLDENVALIVVDLQVATAPRMEQDTLERVVANTNTLAAAFRTSGLTVAIATVSGSVPGRTEMTKAYGVSTVPAGGDAPLAALVTDAADILVSRAPWSAFAGTDLHDELARRGVTQVVVTGVATSIGVESTARDAYALGYSVALPTDAVMDFRPDVGAAHLAQIAPLMAEVTTTTELITALGASER
ncbi:cysteine hydrolase family protein [Microbacterium sp. NPDC090225]|uniref:cysteine hydrolase family protein n=1 Tax=Microbacterium sp. NPDC090225 TaxID=3364207 RepID=UPI0037F9F2AB